MTTKRTYWKTLSYSNATLEDLEFLVELYKNKSISNMHITHPQEYVDLRHLTCFLPVNATSTNRLWHITHKILNCPKCQECENTVKWHTSIGGYSTFCSVKCSSNANTTQEKIKKTNIERYGVDSYSKTQKHILYMQSEEHNGIINSDNSKENKKRTNLERYGVENVLQSVQVQNKIKETNIERYGVENVFSSSIIQAKIKKTNLQKYGYECSVSSPIIQYKIKKTIEGKYGVEYPLQNLHILEKCRDTYMDNTGYYYPVENPEVQDKIKMHFVQKYGCHPTLKKYSKEILGLINCKEWLTSMHHDKGMTLTEISEKYLDNYDISSLSDRMKSFNIEIKKHLISKDEKELGDIVRELIDDIELNNRTIITPKELDIYIPSKNVAIEYCGVYWHNEKFKDRKYHHNKFIQCKELGIRLITIFEDEFKYSKQIVINKLKNILTSTTGVYARKSKCIQISTSEYNLLLENNHIQGKSYSSIKYGLLLDGELVSCIGLSVINKDKKIYNIDRYAGKCRVIGGFSKLLKNVIKLHDIKKIITFSDNRWDTGKMYIQCGFSKVKDIPVDHQYCIKDKRFHKFNFRKNRLKRHLGEIYDDNKTIHQNCINNNIYRIYDCGKIKFELDVDSLR